MKISSAILAIGVVAAVWAADCPKKINSKLICYYSKLTEVDSCKCTHVVLPANSDVKSVDRIREGVKGVKILISVNEFNQGLVDILKSSKVDGVEINLTKLDSKNDINDFISTVRTKLGTDLYVVLSVPSKTETLAKYYDFKTLSKNADLFVLQTAFLGASKNVTFHPSRLSGLWDMQNTDSVVDLVTGLGAPLSKVVVAAPVQAFKFRLQSETHTAPGSPALEVQSVTRDELCRIMKNGDNWTLERDQDQAGPYIFSKDQWIAFDDATSVDIKAKYARVRGLAGLALKDLSQDGGTACESSILDAAFGGLSRQSRAPRGAVLHSLEREILDPSARPLDTVQVSPYRISRVIDVEGNVHVVRQDTRTEFECSRQGYFVHPRSCGRFYRCVKFNQLSDEFSVFEFDCPAGLAFDSRVEVCVWPGSLPNASPCSGSSEIAPVPRERFVCPGEPGYYADPENCRWFFACLDHGKSPLSAYEFRCPFGLVYDESRLLCEWPWLVPRCVSGYAVASQTFYGGAVALDQYDGLGVLKVTRLGGLHGPLQQPPARVYSNVGLLSQEQGQLSLKAAQSLQNAGLLRGGLNSGSGLQGSLNSGLSYSSGLQGSLNSGSYSSGLQGSQGSLNSGSYSSGLQGSQGSLNSGSSYASGLQGSLNSGSSYSSGLQGSLNSGSSYSSGLQGSLNSGLSYSSGLQGSLNSGASYASGLQGSLNTGSSYASGLQGSLNSGSYASGLQGSLNSGSSYSSGLQGSLNSGSSYSSGLQGSANSGSTYSSGLQGSLNTGSSYASGLQGSPNSGLSYTSGNLGLVDASQNNAGAVYQEQNSNLGLGGNSRLVYTQNSDYRGAGYDLNSQNIGASLINVGLNQGNLVTNTRTNYVEHGANSNSQTGSANLGTNLDVSSGTTLVGSAGVGSNLAQSYVGSNNAHLVNGLAVNSGAGSSQYHSSGTNGNINIVGGGYSAVGVSSSGLDLSRLAENSNTIAHVTVSPSISSIPTVTSVPVPALDVASGFESYKGGVVANIPELQYRIENNLGSSRGSSGFANLSTSFVNVVSSTPSTILTDAGYQYPKPTVGFVEEPLRNYQKTVSGGSAVVQHASIQPVIVSTTQTPVVINKVQPTSTSFVQQHVAHIQPVVSTTQVPYVDVQPVVSTYHQKIQPVVTTYQKVQPVLTTYQKVQPAVATYQNVQPVVTTYHNIQPVVSTTQRPKINIQPVVTTYHHQVQQPVVVSTTSAPAVVNSVNIQPAVSTYNVQQQSNFVGYDYSKPAVKFEETPIKTTGGSYSYQNLDLIGKSQAPTVQQVFTYSTPSTVKPVTFVQTVRPTIHTVVQPTVQTVVQPVIKQQPAVAISTFQHHETVQPQLEVTSYNVPSTTVRPLVIQQTPQIYVSSTPASVQKIQPAVVSSFSISSNSGGYRYEKPSVAFEEKPSVVTYQQPAGINYQTPVQVQPAVSTYNYKNVVQSTVRPVTPVVSTYAVKRVQPTYFVSSTPKPQTVYVSTTAQPVVKQRPAVVSSYSFNAQQQNNIQFNGYDYPKPEVQFVEAPTPVVTSYENRQPVQEVPFVAKKAYVTGGLSSTYHYQEQKPVVVENYQIPVVSTTQRPVVVSTPTFEYRQPAVAFKERIVENYQPVITRTPPRPVAVSTTPRYEYQQQYSANSGYVYQKPAVAFEEKIVENYQPAITRTTPQPVTPVTYEYRQEYDTNSGYVYQKPAVAFEERIVENYQPAITRTTSRPVVISTQPVAPVVSTTPRYEHRQEYDTNSGYVYQKPAVAFEERVVENYQPAITRTTSRPIIDYTYQSTPKPTFATAIAEIVATKQPFRYYDSRLVSTSRPVQTVTTSRPIAKYDFGSFDTQANLGQVEEEYSAPIEVEQTPLVVTTSRPIAKYSFSSLGQVVENYVAPTDAITPTREYLPVRSRVRVTTPVVVTTVRPRIKITSTPVPTTPTREYLPVRSRTRITTTSNSYLPPDGDDFAVTTSRPVVRVSRPKTIVKVNDFHPLLAAKLGAQCTCVSNSIKLRNKKVRIIVEDDDDDGYVVDDSNTNDGVVLENYQYEPQRVVDITPTPEVYIQSSTTPQPVVPVVSVRRRVKVRPLTSTAIYDSPVTEVSELFVRKAVTPARQSPNAISSETSKNFDRYGPGGLRSRNERLQGTIDCQRAGLFRHPTQCNKFYACRWDCTKNRYTLHVFNCPVHLTFDNNLGACNWPSQGPACLENTLLPSD